MYDNANQPPDDDEPNSRANMIRVDFKCVEDANGWGKKGDKNSIFFLFDGFSTERAGSFAPGNWVMTEIHWKKEKPRAERA